jgi:hypothetical protein
MSVYNDLFVRDNFGDTGVQPTPDAYVSGSPDIIPYGQGTLTSQQLISQYGPPLINVPVQNNQVNNIYVRAKNNYAGTTQGTIRLYYAPGNLLVNVSRWRNQAIANNNGTYMANVSATQQNQIAPGDQPFHFTPATSLGTHFCFVAYIATTLNPNTLPASDFTSWQAFVNWVRNNAWVAWHNVDVVNTLPANGYLANLAFKNITPGNQLYAFQCTYANMPVGSILRLYALANPGAEFTGFDSGPTTINNVNGQISQGCTFPPSYETTIFTTCQFPGAPVTPPPNVTIETESLGYLPDPGAQENRGYESFWATHEQVGVTPAALGLKANSGRFVPITTFNTLFAPTGNQSLLTKKRR